MALKARKLYFDIAITGADSAIVPLTEESTTTTADRFGALLPTLAPLNGNSPARKKQANEITAVFVPRVHSGAATTPGYIVEFVDSNDTVSPFYTAGTTGTTLVSAKGGASAVFLRNPRVRIQSSATISGTLYVQRQHSIEV
jgi:hypothetical protein